MVERIKIMQLPCLQTPVEMVRGMFLLCFVCSSV